MGVNQNNHDVQALKSFSFYFWFLVCIKYSQQIHDSMNSPSYTEFY